MRVLVVVWPLNANPCAVTTERGPKALGAAIRARRDDMRMSQTDLASRSGVSEATVRRIESGGVGNLRNRTKTGLERALQWRKGNVDRILDGSVTEEDLNTQEIYVRVGDQRRPDWNEDL